LWAELADWPHSIVAFESPRRLPAALASLAAAMPTREIAVCRELTKQFENVVRGTVLDVARRFDSPPKGEVTLVLGVITQPRARVTDSLAASAVAELVAAGVARGRAAALVSRLTGVAKNTLYEIGL
jgi:16S rRNA (cytidine1402-2'-O)-methyltransferase